MSESTEPTPPAKKNDGRDAKGRFATGNPGGKGSPIARHTAELRRRLSEALSDVCNPQRLRAVCLKCLELAEGGDVGAMRLLFERMAPPLTAISQEKIEMLALNVAKTAEKTGIDHEKFQQLYVARTRRISTSESPAEPDSDSQ